MIIVVGAGETYTDLQVALDYLATVAIGPFTETHYLEVKDTATAADIVVPVGLQPTSPFPLIISGRFRDKPVILCTAAVGFHVTVPNVKLHDVEIDGQNNGYDCIFVDDGINDFECRRSRIHGGRYLVNYDGITSTGHQLINCTLHDFELDAIYKRGGDLTLYHNSAIVLDDTNPGPARAIVHIIDTDLTMKQNAWHVTGDNEELYCIYVEELNPPYSTFDLARNLYFPG